jgi:hypothetical protein
MCLNNGIYNYAAANADDLLIATQDPSSITNAFSDQHQFHLKGNSPLQYHLVCDYFKENTVTFLFGTRNYINKMIEQYKRIFGHKPNEYTYPLEKSYHPAFVTSTNLDQSRIMLYQSMIGALQWAAALGRFDTQTSSMTMSRFRTAPNKCHLERLKRMNG